MVFKPSFLFSNKRNTSQSEDLGGEPAQLRGDGPALLEQEAVKRAAAEGLQIHLVLIVPELIRGARTHWRTDGDKGTEMLIRNCIFAQGRLLIATIMSRQR